MKQTPYDLMDGARPMAVDLPEQAAPLEAIKARTLEKVRAAKTPKPKRRWAKTALIAACVAALLAMTATAGVKLWNFTFRQEDDRHYQLEFQQPQPENEPTQTFVQAFDTVYLPTAFPRDAKLRAAWDLRDDTGLRYYKWEWIMDDYQLIFSQIWADTYPGKHITSHYAGPSFETGGIQLAGKSVQYLCSVIADHVNSVDLLWTEGDYVFELVYCNSIPFEELETVIASLQPVEQTEYEAMLQEYAPLESDGGRMRLQQILIPTALPEGLTFTSNLKEDALLWGLSIPGAQPGVPPVQFYQEDVDCLVSASATGTAKRRRDMQDNPYTVEVPLAGRTVQLLGGHGENYLWEYCWEQEGNWCYLRIDRDVADLLGLTMEELAEQLAESLTPVPYAQADGALEALK